MYVYTDYNMERIQVLLDPDERELFRRLARQRGLSLSAWLRAAALKQSAAENEVPRVRSVEDLRAFFAECDAREVGREPDWEEHLAALDSSRRDGIGVPTAAPDEQVSRQGGSRDSRRVVGKPVANRKR
jgi:hypothetical protein